MKPLTDIWERLIGLWDNWGWEDTTTALAHIIGLIILWMCLWSGWQFITSKNPIQTYYVDTMTIEHTTKTTSYCVMAQREWANNRTIACFPTQNEALYMTEGRNQLLHATSQTITIGADAVRISTPQTAPNH
jgi:hypothetical protein